MNVQSAIKFSGILATMLAIFNSSAAPVIHNPYTPTTPPTVQPGNEDDNAVEILQKQEESWQDWSFWWRQTKNVAYATTVVAGVAAAGALTGGSGAFVAAKVGITAVSVSTGAVTGGIAGAGYGVGVAIDEFDSEEPSTTSHMASELGKAAAIIALGGGIMGIPVVAGPLDVLFGMGYTSRMVSLAVGLGISKIKKSQK